jgi:hypothetical protein
LSSNEESKSWRSEDDSPQRKKLIKSPGKQRKELKEGEREHRERIEEIMKESDIVD